MSLVLTYLYSCLPGLCVPVENDRGSGVITNCNKKSREQIFQPVHENRSTIPALVFRVCMRVREKGGAD